MKVAKTKYNKIPTPLQQKINQLKENSYQKRCALQLTALRKNTDWDPEEKEVLRSIYCSILNAGK